MSRPNQRVVCAAIRHHESQVVICGARHYDNVMRAAVKALVTDPEEQKTWWHSEQGFIDQFGAFLTRKQAWKIAEREGQYDVIASVQGGGLSGQAGAVKHGIAQALTRFEPVLRTPVKRAGFLTRDSRTVERKKYGRAKARRSFQFSKR